MGRALKTSPGLGSRLAEVRAKRTREEFASFLGLHENSIGNYERGNRQPDHDFFRLLNEREGTDLNWLITGEGSGEPIIQPTQSSPVAAVLGLASCGPTGWANIESTRFNAIVPRELEADPDAYPVIATGTSMQPFGIYSGFLCWCSPAMRLGLGDIVCLERKLPNGDIMLTIKKLGVIGHDAYELIGYEQSVETPSSEPHGVETQKLFWEAVKMNEIERISVVAHILTRPTIR